MMLKEIELNGFKSFGKKSAISFTTPITAVVGPNGSGKSNIVEAIRFVLGEQSMKSLRGKGGVDLIFKGSKTLSHSSHASVVIRFDNSRKVFSFTNSGLGVSLDYDEISIGREVFSDGVNRYSINGTEVRLKDIIDLLASINIGSSGHHIISQGEADRVLNASSKDRRAMIEDALGLKVYQYRIKESEKKLEKTNQNIKEVQSLKREIAPHLAFLKKQVQVIEKAKTMRDELSILYKDYFSKENYYIDHESKRLSYIRKELDEKALNLDEKINKIKSEKQNDVLSIERNNKIKDLEKELHDIRLSKDDKSRSLGRIDGMLESFEKDLNNFQKKSEKAILESEWINIVNNLEENINIALGKENLSDIIFILKDIKDYINKLKDKPNEESLSFKNEILNKTEDLKANQEKLLEEIGLLDLSERNINSEIESIRKIEKEQELNIRDSERVLYELLKERNEISSNMHSLVFEEEKLTQIKNAFEMEIQEGSVLVGRDVLLFKEISVQMDVVRSEQDDLRRKIERIKIKLEDFGSPNSSDLIKEYEDTEERDNFLTKELDDLNKSIGSLKVIISELKDNLDVEFKNGIDKINHQFQEFFALMFGGGSASLSVVVENKRAKKSEDEDDLDIESDESNELEFDKGIDINVSLPQKKVKDLHMLSGGERSLASIALLFAISQVNPPPFLVLDETDAALDEANSRKYGNMLENLSKFSELVVVTHNRETMSRAQVLYGVTMDSSGVSKLLSIHLEDANVYAK